MRIVIAGGTGHIGRFLAPMLAAAGHEVSVLARGATPRPNLPGWEGVIVRRGDIGSAETLEALAAEAPDVVVDIPGTAAAVYQAVRARSAHVVAIGSLWMYGEPRVAPTPEEFQSPCPFEGYARRYDEIRAMAADSGAAGTVFTAIMPPNICGPGKVPLDCLGGRDIELHRAHAAGREVVLPDGPDALVGPCDAEDIARCVGLAIANRDAAAGRVFNVGSAYALTWPEVVAAYARIYGTAIPIRRVPWQDYVDHVSPSIGHWWHMKAHMCPDISLARRLLGYEPLYTPEETMARGVEWMRAEAIMP
jgi:nucleoside-diphosphate-sugar epimerase